MSSCYIILLRKLKRQNINSEYAVHHTDVIMGAIASQITSLTIVYSTAYSDADQRKHQSSASLAFVWGIHLWPVNSPHKWPVTRKMFPFGDAIMCTTWWQWIEWMQHFLIRDPFSKIFNEIDVPIKVSIFTDFKLYGLLWVMLVMLSVVRPQLTSNRNTTKENIF